MALVAIEEQYLHDIADALRGKLGETHKEPVYEDYAVSHKDNSTSFDDVVNVSIFQNNQEETITFTGDVAYLIVKIAYCVNSASGAYLKINDVPYTSEDRTVATNMELRIEGKTVKFEAGVDSSYITECGYYAEIRGYDAEGNFMPHQIDEIDVETVYKPREMAPAIESMLPPPPEEALVISGDCGYKFNGGGWDWFIENYGDKVRTENITSADRMFYGSKVEEIPFDLNFGNNVNLSYLFSNMENLKSVPKINKVQPIAMNNMFQHCSKLRNVPDDYCDNWDWSYMESQTSPYAGDKSGMFNGCYSLRSFPNSLFNHANPNTVYSYSYFYCGFQNCYALDELVDLPIPYTATWTSNLFSSTFNGCYRLKNITFEMPNGQPKVVNWKTQTIDLSKNVGHAAGTNYILPYNSGITGDKYVMSEEDYQALKNDPDWFTVSSYFSRYNHDSAVATINSLPDTSAYLATAGGTNTIKFNKGAGSKTDGGAIENLTAEEIAVAAAKGWTVTLA